MKSKLTKFKLIEFNNLAVGDFIDLERYIKDVDNNFELIAQIIFRMNEKEKEKNIYIFDTWSYEVIYSGVLKYMKWRDWFYETYKNLFNQAPEVEKGDVDEFNDKWNYYHILFVNFCNEDFFKLEAAFNINVLECFNHLGYLHEKNQIEKINR